jgi:hypothetical protein
VTREFTLISHNGTGDIGSLTINTRPYVIGSLIGLNPQKPYFNSPSIFKATGLTVRVQNGSALPAGLSLDANTGLIYGTLSGFYSIPSTVEYIDGAGAIHGTVTINWDIQKNDFSLVDNFGIGQIQQAYTGNLGSTSQVPLSTASVYRGRLPSGMTLSVNVNTTQIDLTGTPTEAGYFDVWFRVTNANGQNSFLYHRLVIDYINPLVILTSSLGSIVTNQTFNQLLQGYGGIQPYTWSIAGGSPALPTLGGNPYNAGSNPLAFHLTAGGLLTGKTDLTSYNQNIIINLTDSRNPNVTTSAILNLAVNNTLRIVTPTLPNIIPGQSYLFQMQAIAGTAPYTWSLPGGFVLPSGISFNTTTGVFSGVTSSNYSQLVTITVTDSLSASANKQYTLQTGAASGMLIDTSGVGAIDRGAAYQGLLRAFGSFTAPCSWSVASDSPNPLPSGLTLQANASDNGVTATVSGVYSGAILNGYSVKVIAIDNAGNTAQVFVLFSTTSSLAVTTTSLPRGTVSVAYSVQLTATGVNTPFTWSLDGSSPALPAGFSISSTGLLSGTTAGIYSQNIVVRVTDSLSPADVAIKSLNLTVQNSTLAITTVSLAAVTSGAPYNASLAGTGGTAPYAWSVSPNSVAALPTGISLNPSTGALTGTSNLTGFNKQVTFRVTDNITAYVEKPLTVQVAAGLVLQTGIDYTDGTSTNYLGYVTNGTVDSINPRPNKSFYVVASGVVSPSVAGLSVVIGNPGITATVESLLAGVALIRLSGNFGAGTVGDNTLNISVTDSGVNVTAAFKWKVYDDGTLRIAPNSGTFPQQLV